MVRQDYFQLDHVQREQARHLIAKLQPKIQYSEKYYDDTNEYRHVILPRDLGKLVPKRLMSDPEWRQLGVQQSLGWEHYMIHRPEPHILLFRRPKNYQPPAAPTRTF
eukprot:PhM_4_TR12964/c0_g1_i2/m.9157/K02219/CKS1; cyclin-dependent kinase regulatory subunit CKS1